MSCYLILVYLVDWTDKITNKFWPTDLENKL